MPLSYNNLDQRFVKRIDLPQVDTFDESHTNRHMTTKYATWMKHNIRVALLNDSIYIFRYAKWITIVFDLHISNMQRASHDVPRVIVRCIQVEWSTYSNRISVFKLNVQHIQSELSRIRICEWCDVFRIVVVCNANTPIYEMNRDHISGMQYESNSYAKWITREWHRIMHVAYRSISNRALIARGASALSAGNFFNGRRFATTCDAAHSAWRRAPLSLCKTTP